MTDESTEIFDDLYLGLRAGGAVRKQRRGEPLTTEEQEALQKIGEHIYHPAGEHARIRNAIMAAKTSEDYYRDLAWLYGGTGLAG